MLSSINLVSTHKMNQSALRQRILALVMNTSKMHPFIKILRLLKVKSTVYINWPKSFIDKKYLTWYSVILLSSNKVSKNK